MSNEFILSLEIPSVNRLHNSDRPYISHYISQTHLHIDFMICICYNANRQRNNNLSGKDKNEALGTANTGGFFLFFIADKKLLG